MFNQNYGANYSTYQGNNQYYRPTYQMQYPQAYNQPNVVSQITAQPFGQQPIQQPMDIPFSSIKFVTLDEAKGYIVNPNTKEMLVNKANNLVFVKSANNVGDSTCQVFQYKEVNLDDLARQQEEANNPIDTSQFVTTEQAGLFATTSQFDELTKRIELLQDKLEKQIKINEILGGGANGKD